MRSARLGVVLLLVAAMAAIVGLLACGSTGTTTVSPPITGITVRAEAITKGKGCGRGGTQVFKYGVAVTQTNFANRNADGIPFTNPVAGVFDCFTDANFVDLPQNVDPQTFANSYEVAVFAFNEAAYLASGGDGAIILAMTTPGAIDQTSYVWSTKCKVGQIDLVQSLAVCDPVTQRAVTAGAAPATIVVSTQSFAGGDSGTLACNREFSLVRYRFSVNGAAPSEPLTVPCGGVDEASPSLRISPAVAPATYVVELALLRLDTTPIALQTCTASTAAGVTSSAVCKPTP